MPIKVLPPDIAALIAAGEVVQRPASVVKELLDNALDAGATRVTVQIEDGGCGLIRVTDDGSGMSRQDAELCLEKHATSKITTADDLKNILTLGFRGEALAAIGAVSRMEILTRRREDQMGVRLKAQGAERTFEDAGSPVGATVTVSDLFAAVPARRKFLKSAQTEFRHCNEAVVRAALVNEGVHFVLEHGTRKVLDLPRCDSRADRLLALLGRETHAQLYSLAFERGGIQLTGWVSSPTLCRNTSAQVYFFVNDRFVQNRTLMAALNESYRHVLPRGRFPVAVLYLDLDPQLVDINVHPSKMEIRFGDESAAFRVIHGGIHQALLHSGRPPDDDDVPVPNEDAPPPPPRHEGPGPAPRAAPPFAPTSRPALGARPAAGHTRSVLESFLSAPDSSAPRPVEGLDTMQLFPQAASSRAEEAERFVPRAYVLGTFMLAESDARVMLMDTHAAHERIVYERLKKMIGLGRVDSQSLLFPVQVDLSANECGLAEDNQERLQTLGFSLASFGEQTYLVSAIPSHTNIDAAVTLLRDLLADFEQSGGSDSMAQLQHKLLITMSCHSAHRSGDHMDEADMRALLEQYFDTPRHETCPHGRPTALYWTKDEMGRMFGR